MKKREIQSRGGAMLLLYGETGVGKTVSVLKSAPKPIAYFEIDPKPVERTAAGLIDFENIDVYHVDNFLDFFNYLSGEGQKELPEKYKSVVVDPLSYLVNVVLLSDLEDETFKAGVFEKNARPLLNLAKTDLAGYGALSSLAKRLCKNLGSLAVQGVCVICTALLDDFPRWNRALVAAPAFIGKEFNRDYPAYFDAIGLVQTREEEGQIVYPPLVIFDAPEDNFVKKWSGLRPEGKRSMQGPLDIQKILVLTTEKTIKTKNKKEE